MSTMTTTNILAYNAHRNIKGVGKKQANASARLSSGLRINNAADDAAGLAISEKMKAQIRGLQQAERNVHDGIALVQTAEGGMSGISEMILRQRELITQAVSDTLSDEDKAMIQLEIDQLTEEIDSMAGKTNFNTIPLLNVPRYVEVSDSTTITTISDMLIKLGRSPIKADGSFDFIASNVSGTNITDFLYDSTSKTIINVSNGTNSIQGLDLRASNPYMTRTYSGLDPSGTGWLTSWEYDDGNFNFSVNQYLNLVPVPNADGEMYDIQYEVSNHSGEAIRVDMLMSLDIDIESPIGGIVRNPDFLVDGSKSSIDKNTIFRGANKPQTLDIYSERHLNLNLQSVLPSGTPSDPDEIWIGNFYQTNAFGFQENQNISDSAYAIVYNNRAITDGDTHVFSMGQIGVTDPRNNPELKDLITMQEPTDLYIQCGANTDEGIYIDRYDCRASSLGIKPIYIDPIAAAEISLDKVDDALNILNGYRASAGAQQNILEYTAKAIATAHIDLADANSRIADADMAKEMMELTKSTVLQQSAVAMLTQANHRPEILAELLRN